MTQELNIEPSKDGIWTSRRNRPTVMWAKPEDFLREHVDMRMQIPEVGKESAPMADGYIYWKEESVRNRPDGTTYKLMSINREKREDHEEAKALAAQNASRNTNTTQFNPNSNPKWNSNNDWYKITDAKGVSLEEVPGLLAENYKFMNKTDLTKTSYYDQKLQTQIFVMVKTEKMN